MTDATPRYSSAEWQRIDPILEQALELAPEGRQEFLRQACHGDPDLQVRVERLLAADGAAGDFLERPAAEQLEALEAALQADGLAPGTLVGPYRVVRELGRGGMGVVYLADRADGQFQQTVALKVIRPGLDSAEVHGRFLVERQILARLEHPNVARLVDGGRMEGGSPWFAMEYVEGEPIVAWCDARQLSIEPRLRLFMAVCEAVRSAHEHHVIHRDLKPSNLLVTASGQVKLLDFGVAKLLDPGARPSGATRTRIRFLTPEYAAPEQLAGGRITPSTDIYALGAVLYELLSGSRVQTTGGDSRPSDGPPSPDREPVPPSRVARRRDAAGARGLTRAQLDRALRGDLDTIVLTALAREPEARYTSISALVEDLARHLSGRPTLARPPRWPVRLAKSLRRHRARALAAAGTLAAALLTVLVLHQRAEVERLNAAGGRTPEALVEQGLQAFWAEDIGAAQRLFRAALALDSTFALAAYYLSETEEWPQDLESLRRARRLAASGSEWERRYIEQRWARATQSWAVSLLLADSLVERYPERPEAQVALGEALHFAGRFSSAVGPLERAIAMDAAALATGGARCAACEAYRMLVWTYMAMDSIGAAERIARRWLAAAPVNPTGWYLLASALDRQDRPDEALEAVRQSSRSPSWANQIYWPAVARIRAGRFAEVDRSLLDQTRFGSPVARQTALELLTTSYRTQGRLTEALDVVRHVSATLPAAERRATMYLTAQLRFEQGEFREAERLNDSITAFFDASDSTPGRRARNLAWSLLHVAAATAARGDTVRLRRLVDSTERLGAGSRLERDALLHHHLRGLLCVLEARGDEAVAEFRQAVWSLGTGYTRTNLELGRQLLQQGRSAEAVAVVAPALRGALDASNSYVTLTELHELLAQAHERAGAADSAAAHYRWVAAAWANADPAFRTRADRARERARVLARRAGGS